MDSHEAVKPYSRTPEYRKEQRYRYPQKYKQHDREGQRRWRLNNPQRAIFNSARGNSKQRGIEFSLVLEDIIVPEVCPIFGIPLDRRDREHTPTLDRVNNNIGYHKKNVQVISWKANHLKSNGSKDDFLKLLAYIEENS